MLEDADIESAAKHIIKGGYSYSGQRCTAVKVVLALESIADSLVEKISKGVDGLAVGKPEVWCLKQLACAAFSNRFSTRTCPGNSGISILCSSLVEKMSKGVNGLAVGKPEVRGCRRRLWGTCGQLCKRTRCW